MRPASAPAAARSVSPRSVTGPARPEADRDPSHQLSLLSKRWRNGSERFVPPSHIVDTRTLRVDVVRERDAKAFCIQHHYSRSTPPTRLCIGVFEGRELVGTVLYTVPMSGAVIRKWLGIEPAFGVELGRLCLLDRLGFNAESWVIARAQRILRDALPEVQRVVSFADPMERRDPRTGAITKPAHRGVIYTASNASYQGRAGRRWLTIAPNGTVLSPRALSKIRNEEVGRNYAERFLVSTGVEARRPFESGADWLARVLPTLDRVWHPGNFAYRFDIRPLR